MLAEDIDGILALITTTQNYVFLNLGINDGTDTTEGDFKTAYQYVLDAFHTKWPAARVGCMRVWSRAGDGVPCDTLDTWIDAIIAANSSFCFAGPDERIWMENGDDGVTYTVDGVHPNAAGYILCGQQWRIAAGI